MALPPPPQLSRCCCRRRCNHGHFVVAASAANFSESNSSSSQLSSPVASACVVGRARADGRIAASGTSTPSAAPPLQRSFFSSVEAVIPLPPTSPSLGRSLLFLSFSSFETWPLNLFDRNGWTAAAKAEQWERPDAARGERMRALQIRTGSEVMLCEWCGGRSPFFSGVRGREYKHLSPPNGPMHW